MRLKAINEYYLHYLPFRGPICTLTSAFNFALLTGRMGDKARIQPSGPPAPKRYTLRTDSRSADGLLCSVDTYSDVRQLETVALLVRLMMVIAHVWTLDVTHVLGEG